MKKKSTFLQFKENVQNKLYLILRDVMTKSNHHYKITRKNSTVETETSIP